MRELISQPAFDHFRGEEISPGIDIQSDSEIEQAIRRKTITDYHPCGTCAMGNSSMSVVNSKMQVHGIQCLRQHIIDVCLCPLTNLPTESQDLTIIPLNTNIEFGFVVLQQHANQERISELIYTLKQI